MRLQTGKEFNQNIIKQLNKTFDIEMHHTELCGEKAFGAEQKIRNLIDFIKGSSPNFAFNIE